MLPAPILIATRGSPLALAQANLLLGQCRVAFPDLSFALKIIKTAGDEFPPASIPSPELSKGYFTKELELALLGGEADLAVHSLKDLPTDLPPGLKLGAVPPGATIATGSPRRRAQLLEQRADLNVVPIRGNVGTRLKKLAGQPSIDGLVLAA